MSVSIDSIRGHRMANKIIQGATYRALRLGYTDAGGDTILGAWSLYAPDELAAFAWDNYDTLARRIEASLEQTKEDRRHG